MIRINPAAAAALAVATLLGAQAVRADPSTPMADKPMMHTYQHHHHKYRRHMTMHKKMMEDKAMHDNGVKRNPDPS